MKFFKSKDFINDSKVAGIDGELAAQIANTKLIELGKVVYKDSQASYWGEYPTCGENLLKARLIDIESLKECTHEVNQLQMISHNNKKPIQFHCECGKTVIPVGFKEI